MSRVANGDRWCLAQMQDPGDAGAFTAQIQIRLERDPGWSALSMDQQLSLMIAVLDICGFAVKEHERTVLLIDAEYARQEEDAQRKRDAAEGFPED